MMKGERMTYFEDIEKFVGDTVQPTTKAYGKNKDVKEEVDEDIEDYENAKRSIQAKIAQYNRHAKPVEVWTEAQKKMLADIDKLLARPIR